MAKTAEVLLSELTSRKIIFDAQKGGIKPKDKELYQILFSRLNIISLETGTYYRARRIDKEIDIFKEKTITLTETGQVLGFDEEKSGVKKAEECEAKRLNKQGEQVLYLADDALTCFKEIRSELDDYISLAKFKAQRQIKVWDFTPFCKADYTDFFDEDTIYEFHKKGYDLQHLFVRIQEVLMMPEYAIDDYKVPNAIADMIKEVSKNMDVDGIKYISNYTKGHNIALWNFCDMKFTGINGKVYEFYKCGSSFELYIELDTGKVIGKGDIPIEMKENIETDKDKIRNRLIYDLFSDPTNNKI